MNVYLNNVRGIDDALVSLYMSKRSWTREKEDLIRSTVDRHTDKRGFVIDIPQPNEEYNFKENYEKLLRIGQQHTTLLRYIDFSFTVEGLHRGAQDDLDAHAHRFNNRVVRSSTRLAKFGDERSDYYNDKILPLRHITDLMGIDLPNTIHHHCDEYILTSNGYINKTYIDKHPEEENDVRRGLYMLSIPSNCIIKCDLFEFAHVYRMRNKDTHAAPELKDCIEMLVDQLQSALEIDDIRAYLNGIHN